MVVVLPAPLGPRNAKISPAGDIERNAVHGFDFAEGLHQVLDVNHGRRLSLEPKEEGTSYC